MPPKKTAEAPGEKDREAEFEVLMTTKQLELAEAKSHVQRMTDQVAALRAENARQEKLRDEVRRERDDIVAHLQRDANEKQALNETLTKRVNELELKEAQQAELLAQLQKDKDDAAELVGSTARVAEEKASLEGTVTQLRSTLDEKERALAASEASASELKTQVSSTQRVLDDLRLELARSTSITHVSGTQWTLKRSKHRLHATDVSHMPLERERASLTASGRNVVLFGGTLKDSCSNDTHVLNSDTFEWVKVKRQTDTPSARGGQACLLANKKQIVVFGGRRNPLFNDLYLLSTDGWKWSAVKPTGSVPQPVEKSTLVQVSEGVQHGDCLLLLGGDETETHARPGEGKQPIGGSQLSLDKLEWAPVEFTGPAPQRSNMSLTASHDGRFVYSFGGSDLGGACSNDLAVLSPDKMEWSVPDLVMGQKPSPREGHAAAMVDRFLLVSGGWNERGRLSDTFVLDTETMHWECLDAGLAPNPDVKLRTRASIFVNEGRRLLMLGCGATGDELDEVEVIDIGIPEEAFQRMGNRVDKIGLEATQNASDLRTIDVRWQPPPNSKVRITTYKCYMSISGTPLVKEVYAGAVEYCRITGVKATNGYQFRVRGEYSDGTDVWSDIVEVHVRPAGDSPSPKKSHPAGGAAAYYVTRGSPEPTRTGSKTPASRAPLA